MRPFARYIEPAIARQAGQDGVGKSKRGRFAAGTHIMHVTDPFAACLSVHHKVVNFCTGSSRIFAARLIYVTSFARGKCGFMAFRISSGRFLAGLALTGFMLAAAGCQSGDNGILNLGFGKKDPTAPPPPQDPKVLASQLNAYCPRVTVRDGTAFFNTYVNEVKKPKPKLKKTGDAAADA